MWYARYSKCFAENGIMTTRNEEFEDNKRVKYRDQNSSQIHHKIK